MEGTTSLPMEKALELVKKRSCR